MGGGTDRVSCSGWKRAHLSWICISNPKKGLAQLTAVADPPRAEAAGDFELGLGHAHLCGQEWWTLCLVTLPEPPDGMGRQVIESEDAGHMWRLGLLRGSEKPSRTKGSQTQPWNEAVSAKRSGCVGGRQQRYRWWRAHSKARRVEGPDHLVGNREQGQGQAEWEPGLCSPGYAAETLFRGNFGAICMF